MKGHSSILLNRNMFTDHKISRGVSKIAVTFINFTCLQLSLIITVITMCLVQSRPGINQSNYSGNMCFFEKLVPTEPAGYSTIKANRVVPREEVVVTGNNSKHVRQPPEYWGETYYVWQWERTHFPSASMCICVFKETCITSPFFVEALYYTTLSKSRLNLNPNWIQDAQKAKQKCLLQLSVNSTHVIVHILQ